MNNHDELSYIKITTRIVEEISHENDKMKRELLIHRIALVVILILVIFLLIRG